MYYVAGGNYPQDLSLPPPRRNLISWKILPNLKQAYIIQASTETDQFSLVYLCLYRTLGLMFNFYLVIFT